MSAEKLASEIMEANEVLAEIYDQLAKTGSWATHNAPRALRKLQDKWEKVCLAAGSTQSPEFQEQCENLLTDNKVLQTHIVEQAQYFTDTAEDRLSALELLAGKDKNTEEIIKDVFEQWNGKGKPQLICLYEKSEQLEKSILDMMQF
ncbi:MAG: hypothetical protein H8D34_32640 [Chloroflexi bacterium]|nr:hypothetical protein [Chloroflexota bacterium]